MPSLLFFMEERMDNTSWTEIKIAVHAKDVDKAGDIANMTVPYGIYIEDYSNLEQEVLEIAHIDMIDEALLAKDRTKAIIHVYISPEDNPSECIAYLKERYAAAGIKHEIDTDTTVQEDWINNWKQYFKPIPIGEKLLIRPIWEEDFDSMGRAVINLEPGIAFGTGTHETTRLCLELIEKYLSPGMTFLDMGCGSGILSVAALCLGAGSAVGVDIDALAVKTAVENAALNNVSERFTGICGNLTDDVTGRFDIVAANIVADIVIMLSENAGDFMKPNAVYIISGIIDTREQDVLDKVKQKYEIIERREDNGWVAFALRQKKI